MGDRRIGPIIMCFICQCSVYARSVYTHTYQMKFICIALSANRHCLKAAFLFFSTLFSLVPIIRSDMIYLTTTCNILFGLCRVFLFVMGLSQQQDTQEEFKKMWNPRFTLRSHFDAIRSLTFHPSQPVLLTASEDGTLKLWNLNKTMHSKK